MKRRSCEICNLKALLLFFVVLGHGLERDIPYDQAAATLYRVLYLFHMPLFAFVSGLGMHSEQTCFRQAKQAGKLYLYAQGLVLLCVLVARPQSFAAYLARPYWHLWYLLSLASWRFLTGGLHHVLARVGAERAARVRLGLLLLAVGGGLVAGYIPLIDRAFSLSRTVVFLPFFLAGAFWGQEIVDWATRARWLLLALPAAIIGYFVTARLPVCFFYQAEGYAASGLAGLWGMQARLAWYVTAAACSALLLCLCPKGKLPFTQLGGDTLMPYLLHPIFIWSMELLPYSPRYAVPVSLALAVAALACMNLCFKWQRRLFIFIASPRGAEAPF